MSSMVYVKVHQEKIDLLSKIIEAYGHLGIVSTIDAKAGLVVVRGTPDTKAQVLNILPNLPFSLQVISEEDAAAMQNMPANKDYESSNL